MHYKNPNILKFNELMSTYTWWRKTKNIVKIYQENSHCHAVRLWKKIPPQTITYCIVLLIFFFFIFIDICMY